MSEPTLKDVLDAMARLEKGQAEIRAEMATKSELAKVDAKVDAHRAETAASRAEMATKSELAKVDAKVDAHRAETAALRAEMATLRNETQQGFAALDRQLAGHSVITHRALEERVEKIEARLPAPRPAPRAPRRR